MIKSIYNSFRLTIYYDGMACFVKWHKVTCVKSMCTTGMPLSVLFLVAGINSTYRLGVKLLDLADM
jgi:hypothetical protein